MKKIAVNKILLVGIPIIYFFMVWFFPWHYLEFNGSMSVIYFFDLAFVLGLSIYFKVFPKFKFENYRRFVLLAMAIMPIAAAVIWIAYLLKIQMPFALVGDPALQLLILAPIIEELVFRHGFFNLARNLQIPKFLEIHYNSALFAISHLASIWVLPQVFYPFICYQIIYTFFLGRICTKALIRQKTILAPIGFHFAFNLIFYMALYFHWI